MPLPTSLVVKNGSKIASIWSAVMPAPVSVMAMATKSPLRAGLGAQGRDGVDLPDADGEPAFAVHGVAGVDREIDQRGLELRDIGNRKAVGRGNIDLDPDPRADQRANQLGDGFDLGADVEHLGLQRLPAGKRQQLRGQFRGAFHGIGNRIDVTAAPLIRQTRGGAGNRWRSG